MKRFTKIAACAAVSAGVCGPLGAAAAAWAGSTPGSGPTGLSVPVLSHGALTTVPLDGLTSSTTTFSETTVAGYLSTGTTPITSFDATSVVPTLACPTTGTFAATVTAFVGGTVYGGTFVHLDCTSGVASYGGNLLAGTAGSKSFAVSPGEKIATRITVATNAGALTLTAVADNLTTKTSVKVTATGTGSDTQAEAIVEAPSTPVPPFGTIAWSGLTRNGATLASTTPLRFTMVNNGTDKPLVTTSPFSTSGKAFTSKRIG